MHRLDRLRRRRVREHAGSSTSDRECTACPDGQFSDTENAASCTPWTECVPPLQEVVPPTATSDRVCGAESCLQILTALPTAPSGLYIVIDPGEPTETALTVYCDMERDGGGWTLVLQNNSSVPWPTPTFADAVSSVNATGTLGADLSLFDLLLGVDYWNRLGTELRMEVGTSAGSPVQQVIYTFAIDPASDYALTLGTGGITIGTADTEFRPGGYHDGVGFSTSDQDHDSYAAGSCSQVFGGTAWWYRDCWNENLWGPGPNDLAFWNGAFRWGAMWVR